ncbi:MAG: hypothetical protein QOE36_850 [Gaiellaceae bacterium]|nr:hypothetical protein [Gaiellaceae bacterium]
MKRPRLDEPELVRAEYASEQGLAGRASIYATREGPDPIDAAFAAVGEAKPGRVLEVGGGTGALAERIVRELGVELVGIDQSERMVELQRARGIDARLGDAAALPFPDGSFDCVVAAWMLYHVTDLDHGVAELARVLRAGGRLVAVTNGPNHLAELWALVGVEPADRLHSFRCDTGEEVLGRSFGVVERRQVPGHVDATHEDAVRYLTSSMIGKDLTARIADFDGTLRVQTENCVFVATKA